MLTVSISICELPLTYYSQKRTYHWRGVLPLTKQTNKPENLSCAHFPTGVTESANPRNKSQSGCSGYAWWCGAYMALVT